MPENPPHSFHQPPVGVTKRGKPSQTSGKAIASLVLGLVSLLCSFLTGIPGIIFGILALGDISKSHGRIGGKGLAITGILLSSLLSVVAMVGILIAMLLPAVQQVREAARRTMATNNMRMLQVAQLNYESAYLHFPGFGINSDHQGAGLSWRVHLLPFLDQTELYERFNLDEPWDSEHNKALIPLMPEYYVSMGRNWESIPEGHTLFLRPIGMGAFPDPALGNQQALLEKVVDGASQTVAIVEVDPSEAVVWTRPDADWHFDPNDPLAGIGNYRPGGFCVVYIDGSAEFVRDSIPPQQAASMFTWQGRD